MNSREFMSTLEKEVTRRQLDKQEFYLVQPWSIMGCPKIQVNTSNFSLDTLGFWESFPKETFLWGALALPIPDETQVTIFFLREARSGFRKVCQRSLVLSSVALVLFDMLFDPI